MTTIEVPGASAAPAAQKIPKAKAKEGVAPLKGNPIQQLHFILFIAGAVLLPGGLIVIGLGWYGAAHTPYEYDQTSYLISGGILGLGITFVGGFLYFGSWLARLAADQKESAQSLSDTILVLAEAISERHASDQVAVASAVEAATASAATPAAARTAASPARARSKADGAELVVAGRGKTVHRADCDLIAGR